MRRWTLAIEVLQGILAGDASTMKVTARVMTVLATHDIVQQTATIQITTIPVDTLHPLGAPNHPPAQDLPDAVRLPTNTQIMKMHTTATQPAAPALHHPEGPQPTFQAMNTTIMSTSTHVPTRSLLQLDTQTPSSAMRHLHPQSRAMCRHSEASAPRPRPPDQDARPVRSRSTNRYWRRRGQEEGVTGGARQFLP